MTYRDKYGNEINDGATVFYQGDEFWARYDQFCEMYLYQKWFTGTNRVVIPLDRCKPSDLTLWYPDDFDPNA